MMEATSWYEKDQSLRAAYFVLVLVRFSFSCFAQNGYLHPDEFFQSSEVMASAILHINSTVTWEWQEAFPVRSPVSAFLTSGVPFLTLSLFSKLVNISADLLMIFPRIYIVFISIISLDIPVYFISRKLRLNPFHCLFVLSSSYVTHVLASRPFSNMLETAIFGVFLMLLTYLGEEHLPNVKKGMVQEKPSFYFIFIGSLTSLGIFCRQTFLVFALVPYLGYLLAHLKRKNYMLKVLRKIMQMALGFVVATVTFILLDSWYFGYLKDRKIVVTPWNFLKYNSLHSHTHGHHPHFTHLVINIPLLFGPISFLFYLKLQSILLCGFHGPTRNPPDWSDGIYCKFYRAMLLCCVLVPVLILSMIPHQEPRFIMPVLLPLVLVFSSKVVGPECSPTLFMSWSLWNVAGFVFFGILHQGGIVPSLLHLHNVINQKVQSSPGPLCHHVVYFHTYMPPTHLLVWPNKASVNGHRLYIHDLAGNSHEIFNQTLSKLKSDYCAKNKNMLYIAYPATVKTRVDFEDKLNETVKFFPHLTMEDPPNLTDMFFTENVLRTISPKMNIIDVCTAYWNHFYLQLRRLKRELTLNVNIYVL